MNPRVWATSRDGLIQYLPLTYSKLEQTLEVVRKGFFSEETISVAIGLSKHPEAIRELDELVIDAAKDGVSTIAVEKNTGKVAGCLVNKIYVKLDSRGFFKKFICEHPASRMFLEINEELDKRVNAFSLLKTDCYLETMFTGILPQFRRKGIGRKLQEIALETMEHLKNGNNVKMGIDGNSLPFHPVPTAVLSCPTTPTMENICKEIGFEYLTVMDFRKCELQNNILPEKVKNKMEPITIMCKYF